MRFVGAAVTVAVITAGFVWAKSCSPEDAKPASEFLRRELMMSGPQRTGSCFELGTVNIANGLVQRGALQRWEPGAGGSWIWRQERVVEQGGAPARSWRQFTFVEVGGVIVPQAHASSRSGVPLDDAVRELVSVPQRIRSERVARCKGPETRP